jgi:hypothetical protein
MYIYLLKQTSQASFDNNEAFVVRAKNFTEAREIASKACGDEGPHLWLDKNRSSCKRVNPVGKSELILNSYKSG